MKKSIMTGNKIECHVGERIRRRRAELGMTQENLGNELRISYQQIQKYETGANRVSAGRLFAIAAALNVDISYFFNGYELNRAEVSLPHGGRNRAAIELVRNFLEIRDENLRAAITTLLRALKDYEDRGDGGSQAASRHS